MHARLRTLQTIGLASLGSLLEYFDFQVYAFVAALLAVDLFPPGDSVWRNQIQAFGIFAIGYLVRPVAGIAVAHFADRIGRKRLFVFTVLGMAIPTLLMGLLPTYAAIGWGAPASLLLLRVVQGCAVGGELPGGATLICEHARPQRLGLASGIFLGTINFGLLCGAAVAYLAKQVSGLDPALASLAWRLPFVLGGLCGLLAAYLRRHLEESPLFLEMVTQRKQAVRVPVAAVLRDYRWQCLYAVALTFVFSTTPAIYFQWLPTYLIGVRHLAADEVFRANVLGVAAFVASMPLWGMLRDRLGWPALLVIAGVLNAGSALWFFARLPAMEAGVAALAPAIMLVGALTGVTHSLIAGLICALFPTAIRQSGYALPYSVATAVFSGLTPLTTAWLVRGYGLIAPTTQELLAGAVALVLAATLRFLPLHLGTRPGGAEAIPAG